MFDTPVELVIDTTLCHWYTFLFIIATIYTYIYKPIYKHIYLNV